MKHISERQKKLRKHANQKKNQRRYKYIALTVSALLFFVRYFIAKA